MSILYTALAQAASNSTVNATQESVAAGGESASYVSTMANMVGGLIVVLALIFVLAYIVKRLQLVPSQQGVIRTVAVNGVGPKEKLMVVEVNDQQYLIGVTASQISLLDKLPTPIAKADNRFAQQLAQAKNTKPLSNESSQGKAE